MRIQVISRDNGFGLSKDVQVLREALNGHAIDFTDWQRPRPQGHWDWNIHLELVNPAQFRTATINAFVPNPEWFDGKWIPHLKGFDLVLAKTKDCERIFKDLHHNVKYTGWTSPDPGYRVDYSRMNMVHCAGNSRMKGTEQVAQAAKIAQVPVTILSRDRRVKASNYAKPLVGYIPEDRYQDHRRSPVHLCPSTYEGFGHYINEARAMGALIVTTDAAPMDELVTTDYGILVPACSTRRHHQADEMIVCVDALAEGLTQADRVVRTHGELLGNRARAAYERDREAFHQLINEIVK